MLSAEEKQFIEKNQKADIDWLRLKYSKKSDLNYEFLINQIETGRKAILKIPEMVKNNIILPPATNLEQSSSEITAKHKSKMASGKKGIDFTGGFGTDTYYFSTNFEEFIYLEPNKDLYDIVKNNFKSLKKNIKCINDSAEHFLSIDRKEKFDFAYLDPSRRIDGRKAILIEDYSPNMVELQHELLNVAKIIMIKTSPILDIKNTLSKLIGVKEVQIIAVNNDVKEVLYIIDSEINTKPVNINTYNYLKTNIQQWQSILESGAHMELSNSLKYVYEPNSAIMKSGLMNNLGSELGLSKLHQNSHLFTSDELINRFPGRIFELSKVLSYSKKELKTYQKANITVRNFPDSVDQIRKKMKIKDGGNIYLFGTTLINNKPVILDCRKIEN